MACNCPNCGAPVRGPICEYCGTTLIPPGEVVERVYADNYAFMGNAMLEASTGGSGCGGFRVWESVKAGIVWLYDLIM